LGGDVHKLFATVERKNLPKHTSFPPPKQAHRSTPDERRKRAQSVERDIHSMQKAHRHRWYAAQVVHYVSHSRETAGFIYATPRGALFSPTLRIKVALKESRERVYKEIQRMSDDMLHGLSRVLSSTSTQSIYKVLQSRVDSCDRPRILGEIKEVLESRDAKKRNSNSQQLEKLKNLNIQLNHANLALKLTSGASGLLSAFRAENLLQASISKYRPKELIAKYGSEDYDLTKAALYQRHAFYAESTLRAILLDAKEGIGPAEAGKKIAMLCAKEAHERWEALRKRREGIVALLNSKGLDDKLMDVIYSYEVSQ
ncbi:hypothetical protein AAMO2058_001749900, partial [Amorphochlora amoebiformis]